MNPLPQVSPASQDPLAALRPLHLPEPVGWWPPAPGWWLLGLLLMLGLCAAGWWIARTRRRNRYRREALLELRRLHEGWTESGDSHQFASAAGSLLRRAALVRFARAEVAPLCQEQWLAFLDTSGQTHDFSSGPGRALVTAAYRETADCDPDALYRACERWLRRHR